MESKGVVVAAGTLPQLRTCSFPLSSLSPLSLTYILSSRLSLIKSKGSLTVAPEQQEAELKHLSAIAPGCPHAVCDFKCTRIE